MTVPILTPDEAAMPKQRVSDEQIACDVYHAARWGLTAGDTVLMDIAYAPDARDLRAAYERMRLSHEELREGRDGAEAALENDKNEAEHFMRLALVDPGALHVVTWKERAIAAEATQDALRASLESLTTEVECETTGIRMQLRVWKERAERAEAALVDAQRTGWERGRDAAVGEAEHWGAGEDIIIAIRRLQPPVDIAAKEEA